MEAEWNLQQHLSWQQSKWLETHSAGWSLLQLSLLVYQVSTLLQHTKTFDKLPLPTTTLLQLLVALAVYVVVYLECYGGSLLIVLEPLKHLSSLHIWVHSSCWFIHLQLKVSWRLEYVSVPCMGCGEPVTVWCQLLQLSYSVINISAPTMDSSSLCLE